MRPFFFILLTAISLSGCRPKTVNNAASVAEPEVMVEVPVTIPPLEEGEFYYKNKDPFGKIIELTGTNMEPDDDFIFKVGGAQMMIKDNVLILNNSGNILLFDYPSFKFIKDLGRQGIGPEDFVFPFLVPAISQNILCYIAESNSNKLHIIHKNGELQRDTLSQDSSEKIWGTNMEGYCAYEIAENEFLIADVSKTGRSIYRVTNTTEGIIKNEIFSLQLNPNRKSPFNYIGDFGVNPSKNRMVYAYKYFKILKFMDLEANEVRTLNFQQAEFNDGSLKITDGLDQNVTHFWGISAQPDYVYLLYSGRTPVEVSRELQKR